MFFIFIYKIPLKQNTTKSSNIGLIIRIVILLLVVGLVFSRYIFYRCVYCWEIKIPD